MAKWPRLQNLQLSGRHEHLSILTLNVTSPNIQTKHERGVNWIKKQEPSVCCPQGNISHPQSQTQRCVRVKGRKRHSKATELESKSVLLLKTSGWVDFNEEQVRRGKEDVRSFININTTGGERTHTWAVSGDFRSHAHRATGRPDQKN